MIPNIDDSPINFELEDFMAQILEEKFEGYKRVVVRKQFSAGLSGSKVFLIRPISQDGPELPSVVKIDRRDQIAKEWEAFNKFILRKVPEVAGIDGSPYYTKDKEWGILWYQMAGAGEFEVISLLEFLQNATESDIELVLRDRLFNRLSTYWTNTKQPTAEFSFRFGYDSFLPVNLRIKKGLPDVQAQITLLNQRSAHRTKWKTGEWVRVEGFQIVKIYHDSHKLSLDLPDEHVAFKIHIESINVQQGNLTTYQVGQILEEPLIGQIIQTRAEQMHDQVETAVGEPYDFDKPDLTLPNGDSIRNPLYDLNEILNTPVDTFTSFIHGDLNLQNVLINAETYVPYLIDFALSRRDHLFKDLLHLEMSLVISLLSESLAKQDVSARRMVHFYQKIHQVVVNGESVDPDPGLERPFNIIKHIRFVAQSHLRHPDSWNEYYQGLFIYLLGGLRYKNVGDRKLGKLPRQALFWGAAAVATLLKQPVELPIAVGTQSKSESKSNHASPTPQEHSPQAPVIDLNHPIDQIKLKNKIEEKFEIEEMEELAFNLRVSRGTIPGSTRGTKAIGLVSYFQRRGQLHDLAQEAAAKRPLLDWRDIYQ